MKTSHRRSILLFLLFAVAALVQKCIHSLQDFKVHKKSRVESVVLFFIFFYSSLLNTYHVFEIQKNGYEKSPGSNGITTEAFNNLDGEGFKLLYQTIVRYWTNPNYTLEEFTTIKLFMRPKTGDLSNPNKWRGITLGDIAAKSISSIIAYQLTQHLCTFGMDKQCGSLFGKGCADATFTLKKALQQIREQGQDTHVLFVDLVKAYNSVKS